MLDPAAEAARVGTLKHGLQAQLLLTPIRLEPAVLLELVELTVTPALPGLLV
jgi:hypothetical protein